MAKCKTCGATDAVAEFYASIATYCKEHWKERVRARRAENIEQHREYDRQRANLPHRVTARTEYSKTEAFARSHTKASNKWDSANPDRKAATQAVNNAIRDGKMKRLHCFICGAEAEAHHPDYSRPLDVMWLCPAHHKQTHTMARALLRAERIAA